MITLEPLSILVLENKKGQLHRSFWKFSNFWLRTYFQKFYSTSLSFPDLYIASTGATEKIIVPYSYLTLCSDFCLDYSFFQIHLIAKIFHACAFSIGLYTRFTQKLSTLGAETFARTKNREIFDKNFRE